MLHPVPANKKLGPIHVKLFGAEAIVQMTRPLTNLVEQTRRMQRWAAGFMVTDDQQASHAEEDSMARLTRSPQVNRQVLPDISAHAWFGPNFYTRLMRCPRWESLIQQGLTAAGPHRLMRPARYIPQGLRSTLR